MTGMPFVCMFPNKPNDEMENDAQQKWNISKGIDLNGHIPAISVVPNMGAILNDHVPATSIFPNTSLDSDNELYRCLARSNPSKIYDPCQQCLMVGSSIHISLICHALQDQKSEHTTTKCDFSSGVLADFYSLYNFAWHVKSKRSC